MRETRYGFKSPRHLNVARRRNGALTAYTGLRAKTSRSEKERKRRQKLQTGRPFGERLGKELSGYGGRLQVFRAPNRI